MALKTASRRHLLAASVAGLWLARSPSLSAQSRDGARSSAVSVKNGVRTFRQRAAGIDWHCELRGKAAPVVLIPSGEGDCGSFEGVAALLAREFTVLTFDMPGFSRSSEPPNFGAYSSARAANEIAALVKALNLGPATFYGCSSGGTFALSLAADHAAVVRHIVVHEAAIPPVRPTPHAQVLPMTALLNSLPTLSDADVARACADLFRNTLNENGAAGMRSALTIINACNATT